MINRKLFYQKIKDKGLFTKITPNQVKGMDAILDYWQLSNYTDLRWLAYMFGTVYHECAIKMYPIEEYGKGKGRPYGKKLKMSRVPYVCPEKIYFGRGFVQLTWYENYELMGRLLGEDLLDNPELALDVNIATKIMFEGMTKGSSSFGDFTGRCLEMYFNEKTEDWINARKIINGLDKAAMIAGYSKKFLSALV